MKRIGSRRGLLAWLLWWRRPRLEVFSCPGDRCRSCSLKISFPEIPLRFSTGLGWRSQPAKPRKHCAKSAGRQTVEPKGWSYGEQRPQQSTVPAFNAGPTPCHPLPIHSAHLRSGLLDQLIVIFQLVAGWAGIQTWVYATCDMQQLSTNYLVAVHKSEHELDVTKALVYIKGEENRRTRVTGFFSSFSSTPQCLQIGRSPGMQ